MQKEKKFFKKCSEPYRGHTRKQPYKLFSFVYNTAAR